LNAAFAWRPSLSPVTAKNVERNGVVDKQ